MAKVGRASRNASFMRVESLDGTANKTIASAESGEVYLLAGNPASQRTITLPSPKAGAYIKFLVSVEADTAGWKILVPSGVMLGGLIAHVDSGDATTDVSSDLTDTYITLEADTNPGSVIECISDGTNWIASGQVICSVVPTFA
jgi:hypothetical protein